MTRRWWISRAMSLWVWYSFCLDWLWWPPASICWYCASWQCKCYALRVSWIVGIEWMTFLSVLDLQECWRHPTRRAGGTSGCCSQCSDVVWWLVHSHRETVVQQSEQLLFGCRWSHQHLLMHMSWRRKLCESWTAHRSQLSPGRSSIRHTEYETSICLNARPASCDSIQCLKYEIVSRNAKLVNKSNVWMLESNAWDQ